MANSTYTRLIYRTHDNNELLLFFPYYFDNGLFSLVIRAVSENGLHDIPMYIISDTYDTHGALTLKHLHINIYRKASILERNISSRNLKATGFGINPYET